MALTALESELGTHDLALPIGSRRSSPYLAVLILDTGSLDGSCLSHTTARAQQFAGSTKGQQSVITIILDDGYEGHTSCSGLQAFMQLQTMYVSLI